VADACTATIVPGLGQGANGAEVPDILVTKRDDVGIVSLNRPEVHNAVKLSMWRELAGIFGDLGSDRSVRAIVLTGAGANFCVGADVTEFDAFIRARPTRWRSTPARPRLRMCPRL
jgi:enoyl-CoA hydratase/carnithine racemase